MVMAENMDEVRSVLGTLGVYEKPLGPLCTYRVGGAAAVFVEAESVDDLITVQNAVKQTGVETLVIGRGSNLLVSDDGFNGIVVQLGSAFTGLQIDSDNAQITCDAGALMPVAARRTAALGLTGFEWAVGVPGSVGGGVRMNAGGHGSDIDANLVTVEMVDLVGNGVTVVKRADLELGYRSSNVATTQVVLSATFQLDIGDVATAKQEVSEIVQWRRKHQPGGQNAGSVFRNPEGDSAGRIIESLGLKGFRIGSAEVSEKHANFFQADPDGSANDVYELIMTVKQRVKDEIGIELHPENRLIGFG